MKIKIKKAKTPAVSVDPLRTALMNLFGPIVDMHSSALKTFCSEIKKENIDKAKVKVLIEEIAFLDELAMSTQVTIERYENKWKI